MSQCNILWPRMQHILVRKWADKRWKPGLHLTFVVETVEAQRKAKMWKKTEGKTWSWSSVGQAALCCCACLFSWLKARLCSLRARRACGQTETLATLEHARVPENNIIDTESDIHAHRDTPCNHRPCNWSLWAPPILCFLKISSLACHLWSTVTYSAQFHHS